MLVARYPELVLADEPVAPEEEVAPERRPAHVAPQAAHVVRPAARARHRLAAPGDDDLAAGGALGGGRVLGGLVSGGTTEKLLVNWIQ